MSLSRHERLLLDRATAALRRTDPALAAKFDVFGQAADGEPVPGHEQLSGRPGWLGRARTALARLVRPARVVRPPQSAAVRRGRARRATQPLAGSPGLAEEDTMSAIPRVSPLPPDRTRRGHSPLPPDRTRRGHSPLPPDPVPFRPASPLPPDPVPFRPASPLPPDPGLARVPPLPRPRTAPDDQASGGGPTDQPGRGPDGTR